jgi:class 3 adenylate cyclase
VAESVDANRRLTCILAADAVGYSRMMSADEAGTIRVLNAHREVIDSIIASHGGRIVSTAGDSVLAEFGSAVAAVRCATEVQDALKTRNDALPEESRLLFRIGVNLGDVVVKGLDILGDGVNVAARLESIAEPGGICIASSVYDQITGKLDLGFVDMGEQQLKNISRPIRAYQMGGTRLAVPLMIAQLPPVAASGTASEGKSPWMAISMAVAGISLVALAVLAALAWDRGWFRSGTQQQRESVAAAKPGTAPAPRSVEVPKPAPATPPAPVQGQPSKPAVDPTFAALAAGDAVAPNAPRAARDAMAAFSCANRDGRREDFSARAVLRDGEYVVEIPLRGQRDYWRLSGRPTRDDALVLRGNLMSSAGPRDSARLDGRRMGDRFVLDGKLGSRSCSVTISGA